MFQGLLKAVALRCHEQDGLLLGVGQVRVTLGHGKQPVKGSLQLSRFLGGAPSKHVAGGQKIVSRYRNTSLLTYTKPLAF